MLSILWALIIANVLTWFGVDYHLQKLMYELFKVNLSISGYYGLFIIAGMIKYVSVHWFGIDDKTNKK